MICPTDSLLYVYRRLAQRDILFEFCGNSRRGYGKNDAGRGIGIGIRISTSMPLRLRKNASMRESVISTSGRKGGRVLERVRVRVGIGDQGEAEGLRERCWVTLMIRVTEKGYVGVRGLGFGLGLR